MNAEQKPIPSSFDDGRPDCVDCDISPLVPDNSEQTNGVRRWAVDPTAAERLWQLSEQLCGIMWPQSALRTAQIADEFKAKARKRLLIVDEAAENNYWLLNR